MNNRYRKLLSVLMAFVFLLTACAPAAEPAQNINESTAPPAETPAAAGTGTAAVTPPVTTQEVTAAPAETATAAVTEAVTPQETDGATTPATIAATPPPGDSGEGLTSALVEAAPELDGSGEDEAWTEAQEITIPVSGGANNGSTEVKVKSVHDGERVYFLLTWADPTQSFIRSPWVKQADGSWAILKDPDDKGGDNNLYYEDKLAFIWPINNSIPNFDTQGCFTACHAGENSDVKPYGNKYTAEEGQTGDIWHWKSVRNLNQVDDQFLDHVRYSADTPEAGRHSDPNDGGGYTNNETEDKSMPAFMLPEGSPTDGSPGFILDEEKVPFEDTFEEGDMIPAIIKAEFQGDRANLDAGWTYENGAWTLELGRDLETGSEQDVQFNDLAATYYFGLATFDNAQVRHAFQNGATPFTFEQ